ncbi:MAG: phospholipase D family protein [Ardenticatenaceae bacterium]|nr:phospholipase D family protein [Ardenticatenaceae bacterium]
MAAAGRGVVVTIITRQLSDVTTVNYRVIEATMGTKPAGRDIRPVQLYEYQQVEEGRMLLTSHAKVMLVDGRIVYIGSANLTEYGMSRFVEIGITLYESQVEHLEALLMAVVNASQCIEIVR